MKKIRCKKYSGIMQISWFSCWGILFWPSLYRASPVIWDDTVLPVTGVCTPS